MFTGLASAEIPQWAWNTGLALLIVAAALFVFTPVIRWVRERRFNIWASQEPRFVTDREAIAKEFRIPEVKPGTASLAAALEPLKGPVSQVHAEAIRRQRTYHNRVARAVIGLALALVALGLSLTVIHDARAKAVAAAVDILALGIAFQQWWAAHSAKHHWIVTRTRAELLRQWSFLTALLAPVTDSGRAQKLVGERNKEIEEKVVQSHLRAWWRRVLAIFRPAVLPNTQIEYNIAAYWKDYRRQCERMAEGAVLSPDNLVLYLLRRPVRQLVWFREDVARLLIQGKRRLRWLAFFYAASLILACLKALLAHKQDLGADLASMLQLLPPSSADIISLALLLTTLLSAAVTALYLSRNDRSLLHRYATQERFICDWLKGWQAHAAGSAPAQAQYLLDFEKLMVEELIDWIHITAHDTFELSA